MNYFIPLNLTLVQSISSETPSYTEYEVNMFHILAKSSLYLNTKHPNAINIVLTKQSNLVVN